MRLLRYPKSSPVVMILAILGGLVVAAAIVHLVFTFAYVASGLAMDKIDEEKRREEPIEVQFEKPPDPNA